MDAEGYIKAFRELISHKNGALADIYNFFKSADNPAALCEAIAIDDEMQKYAKDPELDEHWNKTLQEKLASWRWRTQKGIRSIDLIIGYIYFQLSEHRRKFAPPAAVRELLLKGITYGSFHCFAQLQQDDINISKQVVDITLIEDMVKRAECAATLHGTPGFLLLSRAMVLKADLYRQLRQPTQEFHHQAIRALLTANALHGYSMDATHNAYCGKSLEEGCLAKYNFANLTQAIEQLQRLFNIEEYYYHKLNSEAQQQAKTWLEAHPIEHKNFKRKLLV